jgi:poly(3-hydroxybutyrate) depolymerase
MHGCLQYSGLVGDVFVRNAGYNGWAEANNIVVLYPQAHPTPLNPKGCFDWYASKERYHRNKC